MAKDIDWYKCYQALDVGIESEWKQVQAAYRRQAQSSHPDRFPIDSEEQRVAELRIVEINQAYHALSVFYNDHGYLPGQRVSSRGTGTSKSKGEDGQNSGYKWQTESHASKKRDFKFGIRFPSLKTLLLVSGFILIYYFGFVDGPDKLSVSGKIIQQPVEIPAGTPDDKFSSYLGVDDKKDYFVPGSTMGEVHAIQGTPTRTEGTTWYYGKSFVTFTDGVVTDWKNEADNPLKIKLNEPGTPHRTAHSRLTSRFTIGSTKADVAAVQGHPISETEDVWDYGLSKVYFKNGIVVRWTSSPMQPLKVD